MTEMRSNIPLIKIFSEFNILKIVLLLIIIIPVNNVEILPPLHEWDFESTDSHSGLIGKQK